MLSMFYVKHTPYSDLQSFLAMRITWETNSITKWANSANNGVKEMKFRFLGDGDGGEYDEIDFVDMYNICQTTTNAKKNLLYHHHKYRQVAVTN